MPKKKEEAVNVVEVAGAESAQTKGKSTELESIYVSLFEDFDGARVSRDIRYGDGKNKFSVSLPIPRNEDEADRFYASTMADLLEKGVKQHSYDRDTALGNFLKEQREKGTAVSALATEIGPKFEAELSTTPERTPSAEKTILKQAKAELGMSVAEMVEFVRANKAAA